MKSVSRYIQVVLAAVVVMLFLDSCRLLNPSLMLYTDSKYQFDTLKLDSATYSAEYRLAPNDVIELRLYANDGFRMIDLISSGTNQNRFLSQGAEYVLDARGMAKLPIVGLVQLDSMTLREAELHLESIYSKYYVDPYVVITISNRRVTIFPGEPGMARVIPLGNNNTTLIEAIALAGGISQNGKANKIKVIRQTDDPKNPLVYKIDLSTIEGLQMGNMIMQQNDIIYVEPRKRLANRTVQEVAPYMSLFSTAFTLYILISRM